MRYKVYTDTNYFPFVGKSSTRVAPPRFILDDEKLKNSLLSSVRIAEERDRRLLENFFCLITNETADAGKAYANLVLSHGRTYVSDIGDRYPFIICAVSVLPNLRGEKYLAFAGTLQHLRGRGFMSNLLSIVLEREKELYGDNGFIFPVGINTNVASLKMLQDLGAVYRSYGLIYNLKGKDRKRNLLRPMYGYSNFMEELKEKYFGSLEFSTETNVLMYQYFRSRGGNMCAFNDGFISFLTNCEEKGQYIITECAMSTETLHSLPSAFEKCILPLAAAEDIQKLKNGKTDFNYALLAVATFDIGERFINPIFNF